MQAGTDKRRGARREQTRNAQLVYLAEVERMTSLTPTQIARESQSDPSTLTRFKNGSEYAGQLSANTIDKIERRFGIPAPLEARGRVSDPPPSLGEAAVAAGLSDHDAEPYHAPMGDPMAALVVAAVAGRGHVVPWTLRSRALEDEAYMPGDILIVDLNGQPRAGDVVCAQIYDFERPRATRTVFRLFHPPFLVGAGREDNARVPHLIDGSVGIKGVVELVIRRPRR